LLSETPPWARAADQSAENVTPGRVHGSATTKRASRIASKAGLGEEGPKVRGKASKQVWLGVDPCRATVRESEKTARFCRSSDEDGTVASSRTVRGRLSRKARAVPMVRGRASATIDIIIAVRKSISPRIPFRSRAASPIQTPNGCGFPLRSRAASTVPRSWRWRGRAFPLESRGGKAIRNGRRPTVRLAAAVPPSPSPPSLPSSKAALRSERIIEIVMELRATGDGPVPVHPPCRSHPLRRHMQQEPHPGVPVAS